MIKKTNYLGKKFNRLTVLSTSDLRSPAGAVKYKCKCDCGNITYATAYELKNGHKKSCGCLRQSKISSGIIGMKFNHLKVLRHINTNKKGEAYYECICDCGNLIIVRSDSLKNENTKSCGCIKTENVKKQHINNIIKNTNISRIKKTMVNGKSTINKSGVKGVYYDTRRNYWYSTITFRKKRYYLGSFGNNLNAAIDARKEAENELFGNFIEWYDKKYNIASKK